MDNPSDESGAKANSMRIVVSKDGPYCVYGYLPLVHKTQVVSEYGEPRPGPKTSPIPPQRSRARTATACAG